jgi:hypothetical protein
MTIGGNYQRFLDELEWRDLEKDEARRSDAKRV